VYQQLFKVLYKWNRRQPEWTVIHLLTVFKLPMILNPPSSLNYVRVRSKKLTLSDHSLILFPLNLTVDGDRLKTLMLLRLTHILLLNELLLMMSYSLISKTLKISKQRSSLFLRNSKVRRLQG
jgi:hypothetical protein